MEIPFGFCRCGCGNKTNIAKITNMARGVKKGEPSRYLPGHGSTLERVEITQPSDPSVRYIPLTQGQVAIVDAFLYEWLASFRWFAWWSHTTNSYYVRRNASVQEKETAMHRMIVGVKSGHKNQVDHEDHNTLDNRGRNLRPATNSQNCFNRAFKPNRHGFRSVIVDRTGKRWRGTVKVEGKTYISRLCDSPEEAFREHERMALEHFGKFAQVTKDTLR